MDLTEVYFRLCDLSPAFANPALAEAISDLMTRTKDLPGDDEQMVIDDPRVVRAELVRGLRHLADGLAEKDRPADEVRARRIVLDLCDKDTRHELVRALSEIAGPLTVVGMLDEAVSVHRRVFHLLRDLAKEDEKQWLEVAEKAQPYSALLARLDRTLDAVMVCRQVTRGLALLVQADREWAREPYALALQRYGRSLAEDGDPGEGVSAVEEAVAQFRTLGGGYGLTLALHLLGDLRSEAGDLEGALVTSQEALREAKDLSEGDYRMTVAMALQTVGIRYTALERWPEARDALLPAKDLFSVLLAEDSEVARWYTPYLDDLGRVYAELGDVDRALELAEEATALYRGLAKQDPATFLKELALSLLNLSHRHVAAEHGPKAVYAIQESVKYYRRLAKEDQAWTLDLARALSHLGDRLVATGQGEAAVEVAHESVSFYRRCTGEESRLGEALKTLGTRLHEVGRTEDSLAATAEAVEVFRAAADLPELANVLFNLAVTHNVADQIDEALRSGREAVEAYQHLYDDDTGWAAALANSLSFLGVVRERAGQFEQAVTSMERAVNLLERLYEPGHDEFGENLARALHNLSRYHEEEGRLEQALECMRRAVTLYGELTQRDPDRFRSRLASAWVSLGIYLSRLDEDEEALSAAQMAVDLYREAGARQGLSDALFQLSNREGHLGRAEESIGTMNAALEIYEELALVQPDPYVSKMAMALDSLAIRHYRRADHTEALPLLERAADIWGQLNGTAHLAETLRRQLFVLSCLGHDTEETTERLIDMEQDLAVSVRTLNDVAQELLDVDLIEMAQHHLARASALWEIHLLQQPDAEPFPYIHVLDSMATVLARLGSPEEAAAAELRVLEIFELLAQEDPDEYLASLSVALNRLAGYLRAADRLDEALIHQRREVEIDEKLAAFNPAYRRSLVISLTDLGRLLEDLGMVEASAVLDRATTLRAALPKES